MKCNDKLISLMLSYFSQTVTEEHVAFAITILTTMIMGGCLIILVENQHTQGEIASRYHSIMRPFYHKLALYAKFAQQCLFALEALDSEGREYKHSLQDITIGIRRLANYTIMTGKDIPYLKLEELETICENINQVWYIFDRNYKMYSHLRFNNELMIDHVREALIAYDRNLSDVDIDLYLYPKVSGEFYVYVWQPIDNIPFRYQSFEQKSKSCYFWLYGSFIVEICCLMLIFISESFGNISLFAVDLLVILSILSFVMSLFKFLKLKTSSFILQF